MKKWIAGIAILSMAQFANAQAWQGVGDQKVQVGFNLYGEGGAGLMATYDYGVADKVSVGAGMNLFFGDNNNFGLNARVNYHLQEALELPENVDIYPGIGIGFLGNDFDFTARIGVRYFFTPQIAVFGEIGNRGGIGIAYNLR